MVVRNQRHRCGFHYVFLPINLQTSGNVTLMLIIVPYLSVISVLRFPIPAYAERNSLIFALVAGYLCYRAFAPLCHSAYRPARKARVAQDKME